jgi:hypothetical protein
MPTSPDTLLRPVRRAPLSQQSAVRVLGVDVTGRGRKASATARSSATWSVAGRWTCCRSARRTMMCPS